MGIFEPPLYFHQNTHTSPKPSIEKMWHGIKNLQISLYHHLLSPEIWFKGYPFLFIALFLSFWEELVTLNSRYNSLLLLSSFLVLTTNIFHNSTRQYLIFLFLLVISLLLDLKSYLSRQNQTTFHLLRFYGITLSKGLVIRNILTYTPPARRIRKYLVR